MINRRSAQAVLEVGDPQPIPSGATQPRVLHVSTSYLPWTVGGKEVYVHELGKELLRLGWDVHAIMHRTPQFREPIGRTMLDDVAVDVLPEIPDPVRRRAVYGCRPLGAPGFEAALRAYAPQIVHFHDFSVGAGIPHLDLAKASGARVVMTYHSPGQSCLQRSLLFAGQTPCDGRIDAARCTRCRLIASGAPPLAARLGSAIRFKALGDAESSNRVIRLLTGRAMTDEFVTAWRHMLATVDSVHVTADWVADLLRTNGARADQLTLIRHGVADDEQETPSRRQPDTGAPLRLAFIGRCDEVKGVHILIEAVKRLPPTVAVEVSLFGPYWDTPYAIPLLDRMRGDARFKTPALIRNDDVVRVLAQFDACVVPSLWLETGPLVMLESLKAGTPVIGSRLGGIAETIRDGQDGLLFTPGDAADLARVIRTLAQDPELRARIVRGVREPRTRADVARDIDQMYRQLLAAVPR